MKQAATMPPDVDHYTCTMHPSVVSHDPNGRCPICGMNLVPVMKKGGGESKSGGGDMKGMGGMKGMGAMKEGEMKGAENPGEFVVPVERQQQIGVTYAKVARRRLEHTIRSVGVVAVNKTKHWEFVARTDGYVDKLFAAYPGEVVEKDQPLLSIYSPDLLSTERELVDMLQARERAGGAHSPADAFDRMIESAERRLRQWNLSDAQIAELKKTRKPTEMLTLVSPFHGIVEAVAVEQGRNIKMGDHLVDVADLSVVSVWVEFYENELSMIQVGQKLSVTSNADPDKPFDATIGLVDPFIDENKRTSKVRLDVVNPGFKLRPGMYVNAGLSMDMGEGLALPASAVMPTGTRSIVFVDHGEGRLEPRSVRLGVKIGDFYEVKSGLAEGERVVSSANFLIDAEAKVQGALKAFQSEEAAPPATIEVKP